MSYPDLWHKRRGRPEGIGYPSDERYGLPGCALGAISIALAFGISVSQINQALKHFTVKGRVQIVPTGYEYTLIIDYAHNAMALESILNTLREYHPGRLISLFGCGGNRDKSRRYEMGEVSGNLADLTVITSDNPRNEEPQAIIDDIISGMEKTSGKYISIIDRREAISYVMNHGKPGDIIILAGKGHEAYQERKGVRTHFSDQETGTAQPVGAAMRARAICEEHAHRL